MEMKERFAVLPATVPMRLAPTVAPTEQPRVPGHLALILQGHARWSQQNSLSYMEAVSAGAGRMLELIDFCAMRSLKRVTLCLFSDDFCNIPAGNSGEFMNTFMRYLTAGAQNFHRNDVRFQIDGTLKGLDGLSRGFLGHVARRTRFNTGMQLLVSIDGHQRSGASRSDGVVDVDPTVHPAQFELRSEPDLVIRTGGPLPDHRAVVWDTRKTALFFTKRDWPDFSAKSLQEALDRYDASRGGELKKTHGSASKLQH